jgi:hypothetical protein
MSKGKLSPEGEVIAAYGAAMVAAFQVLLSCLEENEAVQPGQFAAALAVYMEMVKSRKGDVSPNRGRLFRKMPGLRRVVRYARYQPNACARP